MLQIETTILFDATRYLACSECPRNYNCKKYALICDLVQSKMYFGSRLICVIEQAEYACRNAISDCVREKKGFAFARAKTLYKRFLPEINNYLRAFYKYDETTMTEYGKRAIILTLAESLEYWDLLQHFDFYFSHDIENTRNEILKTQELEMQKAEN